MGEMAEDIIDGTCCELCLQYFKSDEEEGYAHTHGYPAVCWECWEELTKKQKKQHIKAEVNTFN